MFLLHSARPALLWFVVVGLCCFATVAAFAQRGEDQRNRRYDPVAARHRRIAGADVRENDWPQLGGSGLRNNTPAGRINPNLWGRDEFAPDGPWNHGQAPNVKWAARLGSQTYGTPIVANGKIFIGTNNGAGYLPRYPQNVDLGCLLCFRETDGKFLWQYSSQKLPTGRVHDWPLQGICSSPVVEGQRLWFVTNRGEVVCLDTEGYHDGWDDGRETARVQRKNEADVVWRFDMMKELGVSQHNMATCAPTIWGHTLFVCTSNGVDETHVDIPAPDAPSFLAMDKHTGEVLWTDNSPGKNILHGQWSCPAVGVFDGVPQVIFPGGDGWLYSFRADRWKDGRPELLWKFDANPKSSEWTLGGSGTRNNLIAVPVIYDGLVYSAVGQDPEHGEGTGHLWCIDPTKRGDVSPELAIDQAGSRLPRRRIQGIAQWKEVLFIRENVWEGLDDGRVSGALREHMDSLGLNLTGENKVETLVAGRSWILSADGERFRLIANTRRRSQSYLRVEREVAESAVPNRNSAVVWHYDEYDLNKDGEIVFEEMFHRTIASPAIKNDLLIIPDFAGLVHCLDAKTGVPYWTCDMLAAAWSSPVIVGDDVFVGDEDGEMAIFALSPDPKESVRFDFGPIRQVEMNNTIYSTPTFANGVLYVATKTHLFAIESPQR